jgi:hypothetical protein
LPLQHGAAHERLACSSNVFFIAFSHAMQVVGVVRQGLDLLDLLDDVPRSPDDTPLMRIKVVKCGNTNAQVGNFSLNPSAAARCDSCP